MAHFSEEFTQKYALSKTLRFELKPVGRTQEMLEGNKVFLIDENIKKKYIQTKPFLDQLHREFIQEALSKVTLSGLENFFQDWKEYKKDKKAHEKSYKKASENLRKELVSFFDVKGKEWAEKYHSDGLKKADKEILFEEWVFQILEKRYGTDLNSFTVNPETGELTSIFGWWKGFTGYFTKFFETRKNYYKVDGTSTAIATRIVDHNFVRYLENLEILEKIKNTLDLWRVRKIFENFDKVFLLENYNTCLLQEGIDMYNRIIGGYVTENGEKIPGINEQINQYRQTHKDEKIPFLKLLEKQIGSEKQTFLETIDSPEEFRDIFGGYIRKSHENIQLLSKGLSQFFSTSESYDLGTIFLSKEWLNTISHRWTDEASMKLWQESLYGVMKKLGASHDKKDDEYKFPDFIALSHIKSALDSIQTEWFFWKNRYGKNEENSTGFLTNEDTLWSGFIRIFQYEFNSLFNRTEKDEYGNSETRGYDIAYENIIQLTENTEYNPNDETSKVRIKVFADETLKVYQMGKYFAVEKKRQWNPDNLELGEFYTHPEYGYEVYYADAYKIIVQGYNDIRNYLTKNPWSEEKWKLNFLNPTLANGWDKNKESDNSCVILRKNGKIFLGLMSSWNNQAFDKRNEGRFVQNIEQGRYEKMVYKFFPDQAKMFPKVCFSVKWLEFFKPSEEIYRIYKNEEFKKGDAFSVKSMQKLIDFYKDCLGKYEWWQCYFFRHLKPTDQYMDNIGEFFRDVAQDGYQIAFQDIAESYISELIESGQLYLFEIYNQDFWAWKTGHKNLHTLYFENIFSEENKMLNFPLKLNGQAEIFFRPKSMEVKTEKRNFSREIVAKKRYTEDKIFFHVPLTFNRTQWDIYGFNTQINNFLANNPDINIIGVDRGEKHLAYYSIVDQKGNILLEENGYPVSGSLNAVNGVNYGEKLADTAERRKQARQDWQVVEGIKNLKKWYISAVVRKLADLAIQYNAIIVFEDLNMRFKQIRWGIEKSVYQQLEKTLIEKLNFLVEKWEADPKKAGHLLNAYQLTAPFETFKDMGKQTGIIFYTQAAYTSKIDPVTGWRPHLYLKYSSAEQAKKEIMKFSRIVWNALENRFEFTYDIKNFSTQKEFSKHTIWTVCSSVERYRWDKGLNQNKGDYKYYPSLTSEFGQIFIDAGIDYKTGDILKQIEKIEPKGHEKFFRDFLFFFSLVCQIRNTNKTDRDENKQDFILSPVVPFFDSRKSSNGLPKNGDENGAYNIARKGIMILNKINEFSEENGSCEKMKWGDLSISNIEWDNFIKNQ